MNPAPQAGEAAAPRRGWRPSLALVFTLTALALAASLAALYVVFEASTQRLLLQAAEKERHATAREVADRVTAEMSNAPTALDNVARDVVHRVVDMGNLVSVEATLFSEILAHPRVSEVSFIAASVTGFDGDGAPVLAPGNRWQVTVERSASNADQITTRRVFASADGPLVLEVRARAPGDGLQSVPFGAPVPAADPTEHLTFLTTASQRFRGQTLWSDLHYSQTDNALPEEQRRIILTVQRAVEDARGVFRGVVRVGMVTSALDELVRVHVKSRDEQDAHAVFLGDSTGGLITRFGQDSRLRLTDGELRVEERGVPRAVNEALQSPITDDLSEENPEASGSFVLDGQTHLMTFRRLPLGREWNVGVVVPLAYYTRELAELRRQFVPVFVGILVLVLLGGALTLLSIRRGLGRIQQSTEKMRAFDFSPATPRTLFRDVELILESVERAKTIMRALGRYVPVELVRQLFNANREPRLGGRVQDLSIMFTDLQGFTSLAEKLSPDVLARKLGAYLEVMTNAVHAHQGVIDKYIGDAVMAMWNAPTPTPSHAEKACRAALASVEATARLYRSPVWEGLPPLVTRFGIHRDNVMVGHFGAPDRMSFTALGDGVNLAARLESLCKQYGVTILVSDAVMEEARHAFVFRAVDVVAVKGKTQGVRVHELLGPVGMPVPAPVASHQAAFAAYLQRDFHGARQLLAAQLEDGPSRVLSERCSHLADHPPPADWDGVWVATSK